MFIYLKKRDLGGPHCKIICKLKEKGPRLRRFHCTWPVSFFFFFSFHGISLSYQRGVPLHFSAVRGSPNSVINQNKNCPKKYVHPASLLSFPLSSTSLSSFLNVLPHEKPLSDCFFYYKNNPCYFFLSSYTTSQS